jgi:hypothetical protein
MKARSSGRVAPGYGARSQRTNVQPLAAIGKPVGIPQEHFDVSQQPMRHQHGLGMLQMRVSGHGCAASFLGAIGESFADLGQLASQLVDRRAHV